MSLWVTGYAKLWDLKPSDNGKYTLGQLSSTHPATDYEKQHGAGDYVVDFSKSFVRFINKAHNKAQKLQGNERINITSATIQCIYSKEKQKEYTNLTIFDFEVADSNGSATQTTQKAKSNDSFMDIPDNIDEELPFQ